ncbi:hypothetical protein KUM39_22260 [Streptomyces sp. J2-1]|uniref:hypothetical protein n=1 Tax=Streptomyces corallincola TaxID=2851888 RepID=UPI001C383605|nr:hypothetical protein [Streptomyces corallincola]MBV2357063.1 hypothetical protein [Streptomyces corallincola]
MKNLTRRTATLTALATLTGTMLIAGGGAALAAPPQTAPNAVPAHHHGAHQHGTHHLAAARGDVRPASDDPWVAGQIARFYPSAATKAAVYDPWVGDQLAWFGLDGH